MWSDPCGSSVQHAIGRYLPEKVYSVVVTFSGTCRTAVEFEWITGTIVRNFSLPFPIANGQQTGIVLTDSVNQQVITYFTSATCGNHSTICVAKFVNAQLSLTISGPSLVALTNRTGAINNDTSILGIFRDTELTVFIIATDSTGFYTISRWSSIDFGFISDSRIELSSFKSGGVSTFIQTLPRFVVFSEPGQYALLTNVHTGTSAVAIIDVCLGCDIDVEVLSSATDETLDFLFGVNYTLSGMSSVGDIIYAIGETTPQTINRINETTLLLESPVPVVLSNSGILDASPWRTLFLSNPTIIYQVLCNVTAPCDVVPQYEFELVCDAVAPCINLNLDSWTCIDCPTGYLGNATSGCQCPNYGGPYNLTQLEFIGNVTIPIFPGSHNAAATPTIITMARRNLTRSTFIVSFTGGTILTKPYISEYDYPSLQLIRNIHIFSAVPPIVIPVNGIDDVTYIVSTLCTPPGTGVGGCCDLEQVNRSYVSYFPTAGFQGFYSGAPLTANVGVPGGVPPSYTEYIQGACILKFNGTELVAQILWQEIVMEFPLANNTDVDTYFIPYGFLSSHPALTFNGAQLDSESTLWTIISFSTGLRNSYILRFAGDLSELLQFEILTPRFFVGGYNGLFPFPDEHDGWLRSVFSGAHKSVLTVHATHQNSILQFGVDFGGVVGTGASNLTLFGGTNNITVVQAIDGYFVLLDKFEQLFFSNCQGTDPFNMLRLHFVGADWSANQTIPLILIDGDVSPFFSTLNGFGVDPRSNDIVIPSPFTNSVLNIYRIRCNASAG